MYALGLQKAAAAAIAMRKIVRVPPSEPHTLVAKKGSQSACLLFTQPVCVRDVQEYCRDHMNWDGLNKMSVIIDGKRHDDPTKAAGIELPPSTKTLEFSKATGAKG